MRNTMRGRKDRHERIKKVIEFLFISGFDFVKSELRSNLCRP